MTITTETQPVEVGPESRGPALGRVTAGALFLVGGALWLADVLGWIEVSFGIVLPVMLTVLGAIIVIASFQGPQPGLIVAGVFLAVATLIAAVTPPDAFHGGIGERRITVTDQADLQTRYDVGVGQLRLDLSQLDLSETAVVTASVGAGDLVVILPPDVAVKVSASVGAGEIRILGERTSGISRTLSHTTPGFDNAAITLELNLSVAAGDIEVRR